MTESSAALISHNVTKTYGQCVLLISLPQCLVPPPLFLNYLSPPHPPGSSNATALLLTRLSPLLLLNLLQAPQQRVDLHLDLSQLPFDGLKLVRLHCWGTETHKQMSLFKLLLGSPWVHLYPPSNDAASYGVITDCTLSTVNTLFFQVF